MAISICNKEFCKFKEKNVCSKDNIKCDGHSEFVQFIHYKFCRHYPENTFGLSCNECYQQNSCTRT